MPERSGISIAPRILIVEDEIFPAKDLAKSLTHLGYEILGRAASSADAIRVVQASQPDLILMDITLREAVDGIETAREIRSRFGIPVVYLTALLEKDVRDRAESTQASGYLRKSVALPELKKAVETALNKHEAHKRKSPGERHSRLQCENASLPRQSLNEDGTLLEVNQSWLDMLGYSSKEVIGKWFGDLLAPRIPGAIQRNLYQTHRRGTRSLARA